jgi:hypothetical protein
MKYVYKKNLATAVLFILHLGLDWSDRKKTLKQLLEAMKIIYIYSMEDIGCRRKVTVNPIVTSDSSLFYSDNGGSVTVGKSD